MTEQDKLDQYFKESFQDDNGRFYITDQQGRVPRRSNGEIIFWTDPYDAAIAVKIKRAVFGEHWFVVSTLSGQIVYPEGVRWPL